MTIFKKNKTKIIFWGTPKFAQIILQKLIQQDNFEIVAVVTAPDKKIGRKQILTPSPVKILAEENQIPVLTPHKLDKEFITKLKELKAEIFITAAYGKIIPQEILGLPLQGNVNVHPSVLPKYRGPSPIQSVLLNEEKQTGVSIMLMDKKMDHGPILTQEKYSIKNNQTYIELSEKLAQLSANLLVYILPQYITGEIEPKKQIHENATFCKIIKKEDGKIDWNKPAEEIYNMWRAFIEWPQIYDKIQDTRNKIQNLKVILKEVKLSSLKDKDLKPGDLFTENKKLYVVCGKHSVLEIKKIQPQGKKEMDAAAFINGYLK